MFFSSFEEFIAMGGHAPYVWTCYAVALGLVVFYFFYSSRLTQKKLIQLEKFYRRVEARNKAMAEKQEDTKTHDLGEQS